MSSNWYDRIVGSATPPKALEERRILVVDDHVEAREVIAALVGRLGWPVLRAGSGNEAKVVMDEHHKHVALALVDVILADTDGMSLAKELRERYPRLAIVLLSGQLNDESRWIVSEEGFRFLPKPFTFLQLRDVIAETLGDSDAGGPAA